MDPDPERRRVYSERYELDYLIARGGMAEVYRARDRLLDRPVALKILFPELSIDRTFVERFKREAQAAANLSHPNIVPVFDWGEDSGTYFIVMEFVDGRALSTILKASGTLPPERAAEIGAAVAAALGYAHKNRVIHRDVKPGNVLITDESQVKVTDFGIARALNTEESLTQTGAVMGTATYFSPEQAEGIGVDARSDIYSLGVVLFEMVTGRPPFTGDTPVAVASKHVRDRPPAPREINPSIPPTFEAIILKAMSKDPAHRYQTAEELRADLLRFNEGRSVLAMNDTTVMAGAGAATQVVGAVDGSPATRAVAAVPSDTQEDADDEGPNRTRTYAIILAILIVLLLVAGYFLGRNLGYFGGAPSFNLPSVVGQQVAQATSKLETDGLVVKTSDVQSNDAPGTVISTDPPPNSLVQKGNTVTLKVATAPPVAKVAVPAGITNTTLANAKAELQAAGLNDSVTYKTNNAADNTVLSASPSSGTKVAQGSTVTLTVSSGPANVVVPSVAGLSEVAAANLLGQYQLVAGYSSQFSPTVPAENVITSSPGPGTPVPPGSTVTLIVSEGAAPTTTTTTTTTSSTSTTTTTSTTNPGPGGGGGGGGGGNHSRGSPGG
jgi:beta-lactam-binding protein with PASTA domain/tRNA A-37 threonylcarbamoyl transferase component Bud32